MIVALRGKVGRPRVVDMRRVWEAIQYVVSTVCQIINELLSVAMVCIGGDVVVELFGYRRINVMLHREGI